ncbi:5-beta-cholestane-3-alpha,7-alpha-diol 12-alpha-hydroxylase-like [Lissotriton helveticus]
MPFVVPLMLALIFSAIGGLYLLGLFRRRRPNEPPLDKGYIPWLGYALECKDNGVEFLKKMQKKHGDIFTVQIGGYYITFLLDPLSFGSVLKESRSKLDFDKFAQDFSATTFSYYSTPSGPKDLQTSNTKYLMGDGLMVMTQAMMENLQNLMLHSVGSGEGDRTWKQDGLSHFSYNIVFHAGYLSLFGNESAKQAGSTEKANEIDRFLSEELYHKFRKYDRLIPQMAYSILPLKEKLEAERLKRYFWNKLSAKNTMNKDNVSGWISDQLQCQAENGMDEYMQDRLLFVLLWISQNNTGPAGFWLLLHLMKNPEAMKALREEIDHVIKTSGQEVKPGSRLLNLTRDMLLKTPVLDSAVEESQRLTTAPVLMRGVLEDMNLQMADGREYAIRKGDRVALFPYIAVQMDPEVHPEPHIFKYNRFLNPDGSKKVDFYKDGKKVKYFSMPWGGGVSICPGRFFAVNELKQFVFLMLTYFEFELLDPQEDIPPIDQKRWGFGTLHPIHDIQFRYRLRF